MEDLYDAIIIGGGPAGLTAAIYLARARYRVLLLEKEQLGGQIAITDEVVNYPGIQKTSGKALTATMVQQAEAFGAKIKAEEATALDLSGDVKVVRTNLGSHRCFGILLATGAHPHAVGFQGEQMYRGRGVAYCATCDGEFFTDKEVFVIGGGYAAAEESVFLTKYARHVTILIRKADFSCAASVAERARKHDKITVLTNTVVEEVSGDQGLQYIRYKNNITGEVTEYRAKKGEHFGVFVLAGYAPNTDLVKELAQTNQQGYILTDAGQKTSREGLYAAGDVCAKALRQVVTATGDGALAAAALEKYASLMQEKTGLRPVFQRGSSFQQVDTTYAQDAEGVFTPEMRAQLENLFAQMERPLVLKLYLDDRAISEELEHFARELVRISPKLTLAIAEDGAKAEQTPFVSICTADGAETGLAFHGVPGGHEFTSFVLGLYNAAGPGQPMDEGVKQAIGKIGKKVDLKLLVTLSCSMCPELVTAAQRIAAESPNVTAHVYDIRHFESLKQHFQVMSVPCMVIDDQSVFFGKKDIQEIMRLIS